MKTIKTEYQLKVTTSLVPLQQKVEYWDSREQATEQREKLKRKFEHVELSRIVTTEEPLP